MIRPAARTGLAALALGILPLAAGAQVRPDAGSLQRDFEREAAPAPRPAPPPPGVEPPPRPALQAPSERRFPVRGFRVLRATVFPEPELQALLAGRAGDALTLADLQRAAEVVTRHYQDRGYFVARAYVPAQEIRDGIVDIVVLEGFPGGIALKMEGSLRLRPRMAEATLRAALPEERPITAAALDRGLLLLNDLAGVQARALLSPGEATGTTIVTAELAEGPLASGAVDADNQGNKYTGRLRLGGHLLLNGPLGFGDLLSVRGTASNGTQHARIAYQLPVTGSGLRLGLAYAETGYRLCCDFSALEAEGSARSASFSASYPFLRSRDANLYGNASLERRRFYNRTIAGTTSDKTADARAFGLVADRRDAWGGGGLTTGGITLHLGRLDLSRNAADEAADALAAATQGRYRKLTYSAARVQRLGDSTSLYGTLSGQVADRNLDSSEKFVLGGPGGVRAFPVGEAAGDRGVLVSLEFRYEATPGLQWSAFLDHGSVRLHQQPWAGWQGANARLENRYALSGAGIGILWSRPGSFQLRATLAARIGDNPGRDALGNDVDNTRGRVQLWMQGSKVF